MIVTYSKSRDRFEAISKYEEKDIVKNAGFWWDKENKVWYAYKAEIAKRLEQYFDKTAKEACEHKIVSKSLSTSVDTDIDIPAPAGLEYLPFQKAGIQYALMRDCTLIADEMGLGKTIQAIGVINATKPQKVVVVCPALLKLNWRNELLKWLVANYRISIVNGNNGKAKTETYYCKAGQDVRGNIIIINYDILQSHLSSLRAEKIDLLICDESQYIKSQKAQRTQAVSRLAQVSKRKVFLTGTPILNRPVDLFPTLQMFRHKLGDSYYRFIVNWCNAYKDRFGWKIGYPNKLQAEKLQSILRETIMVRRMKADVLTELPQKRRQIVTLEADSVLLGLIKKEKETLKTISENIKIARQAVELSKRNEETYREAIKNLKETKIGSIATIAKLRHETALAKVPLAIKYIDMLLDSVEKLVVFTYHKDVLHQIFQNYKDIAVTVTGDDTTAERQIAVEKFQNDTNIRLFFGTLGAASTGITLTAASNVLLIELDWTPSVLQQAEDRVHRIGQKDSVNIYYLVVDKSIDAKLAKIQARKLDGITKITDLKHDEEDDIDELFDECSASRL